MSQVPINDKVGFGTMSLTWKPTPPPLEVSAKSIDFVTKKYGVKFLNGGEFYGLDNINLKLFQEFFKVSSTPTSELIVSIKGGYSGVKVVGTKEVVSKSIENIVSYFPPVGDKNRPKILYEQSRVDPEVPYADTIGYIYEYVKSGQIDGISLSETSAETIAIAADEAPISGVEVEFSLISQDIVSNGVLAEATKRGIPIIAYSPLGRGLLTDYMVENNAKFLDDIPKGDMRHRFDRFAPENFKHNLKLIKKLYDFAHEKKGISLEALALSWITSVSGSTGFAGFGKIGQIIPIPSGSTPEKIESNFGHLIKLTEEDLNEIQAITSENNVQGLRYNAHMEKDLFR
ncbi:putative pyridoxal reductase [[Candida] railenensis]|uniref:Pyridoxal reductase n=1 Tax=[Candida] railenensis TaxID=45579 RepID=A0A9P0QV96_9ASCO|nr:putative pyridoxal reductase [[Candida] railenensis]